ncbi:MAG: hypothetical protein ACLFT3_14040 [Cyclobacteriaceae bacterium]
MKRNFSCKDRLTNGFPLTTANCLLALPTKVFPVKVVMFILLIRLMLMVGTMLILWTLSDAVAPASSATVAIISPE